MGHNDNRSSYRALLSIIAIVLLVIIAVTVTVIYRPDDQPEPQAADISTSTQPESDSRDGNNQWSLTKPGHIDNVTAEELRQLLGSENVTVTLSV